MKSKTRKIIIGVSITIALILLFKLAFLGIGIDSLEKKELANTQAVSPDTQPPPNTGLSIQSAKRLAVNDISKSTDQKTPMHDTDSVYTPIDITIREIASDYTWAMNCGVKQPLGAYKNGWSIHQVSKHINMPGKPKGNPDYIFWVNEKTGDYGVSERPTNSFGGAARNPGGMVSFSENGTIWYTYGARGVQFDPDIYSSKSPYDVNNFTRVLNDYVTINGGTAFCLNVHASKAMLCWRQGWSGKPYTTVRFRRYNNVEDFGSYAIQMDLGKGAEHDTLGKIGIEQVWAKFDPRFNYFFVMWQWFDVKNHRFGSYPFIYSDDFGNTWKKATGEPYRKLPISYLDIDNIIVPYNHLAKGENAGWFLRDMGVSPNGTFWMTIPYGNATSRSVWSMYFWFFDGTKWQYREMADKMPGGYKNHSCGVTKDYIVFVYSDEPDTNILKIRISNDDGRTWTKPFILDVLEGFAKISWISFVQPSAKYGDNSARFFYGYHNTSKKPKEKKHMNNIKCTRIAGGFLFPQSGKKGGTPVPQSFSFIPVRSTGFF